MAGAATAVGTEGRGLGTGGWGAHFPAGDHSLGVSPGNGPRPCDPFQPPFREREQVRPREGQDQRRSERWAQSGPHPGSWSHAPEAPGAPSLGQS